MSPTDKNSVPSVRKFDRTNHPLWAFKMEMYLKGKGSWEVVGGYVGTVAETAVCKTTNRKTEYAHRQGIQIARPDGNDMGRSLPRFEKLES